MTVIVFRSSLFSGIVATVLLLTSGQSLAQDIKPPSRRSPNSKTDSQKPVPLSPVKGQEAIAQLSHDDWRIRERATQTLIKAGPNALPLIRQGLMSSDPEVRLRCLFIIRRPHIMTERLLGHMTINPREAKARIAFDRLAGSGEEFKEALLMKIQEYASNKSNISHVQRLSAAMDVLSEIVTANDSTAVMNLLKYNLTDGKGLGDPFPILVEAIAKLPRREVIGKAIELLQTAQLSANPYQGSQACHILGEFGSAKIIPDLLKALTHKGSITRMAVARAMRTLNPDNTQIVKLIPLLNDEDSDAILLTLDIFAQFRCREAVPETVKLLSSDSQSIVNKAIYTLGMIGDESAQAPLKALMWPKVSGTAAEKKQKLLDKKTTRGNAAWALALIKKGSAAELIGLIEAEEGLDYKAFLALAAIASKDAVKHLQIQASGNKKNDVTRSLWAIRALGQVKNNPESSRFLYDLIKNSTMHKHLHVHLVNALRDQNTADSRKLLLLLLDESNSSLLNLVYDAVGDLGIHAAVPKLIKKLDARAISSSTLSALTTALGNLGGKDVIAALRAKYKSQRNSASQRRTYAWALARAGERVHMKEVIKETKETVFRTGTLSLNRLGIDYLYAHDWKNAKMTFRRMLWINPKAQFSAYNLACVQGLKNNKEISLRLLRRSIKLWPDYWRGKWRHVATDPDLKNLHAEKRFQKIVERLKMQNLMDENARR
jgi:HEAT repeat protein